jgi:hypothetical protein
MIEMKFNEEDKQKFIDFLNMIADKATFNLNTSEIINYFKLIQHMQVSILPKINANILEIKKIHNPTPIAAEQQQESQPQAEQQQKSSKRK